MGLRFSNLQIPPGAFITAAEIQFTTDEAGSAPAALRISVQAADDAAPFSETARNLSGRPRAPVQVPWEPAPWNTEREASREQRTPDLSALVQAVVNRPGWEPGNHMVFLITGSGRRTAQAHDKPQGVPAQLSVRFTAGEPFRRGDANGDSKVDITDALVTLGYLFLGDAEPPCLDSADADDSGRLDIADAVRVLGYRFFGAEAPPEPGPAGCGEDPTEDRLRCVTTRPGC